MTVDVDALIEEARSVNDMLERHTLGDRVDAIDRLAEALEQLHEELAEAHTHFGIQEGRIRAAEERADALVRENLALAQERDEALSIPNPYRKESP